MWRRSWRRMTGTGAARTARRKDWEIDDGFHQVPSGWQKTSRPAVSRHLRVLREVGLVRTESHGRRLVYNAAITPLGEVIDWIDGLAPRIIDRLDALETEVYRTRRDRTAGSNQSTETIEELTA